MVGWILRSRISEPESDMGHIICEDGKLFEYAYKEQHGELSSLELDTCVSFSDSDSEDGEYAVIEKVLKQKSDSDMEKFKLKLRKRLSDKRYYHSVRVSIFARILAGLFDCDVKKAEIAGLLHDAAKERTREENQKSIIDYGLVLTGLELEEHSMQHAAAGMVLAAAEFGVDDGEILTAIRNHNGRPAMNRLEKVVFLADHLDYMYKRSLSGYEGIILEENLDLALFKIFMQINKELVKHGKRADAMTEATMNYMFVSLNDKLMSAKKTEDRITPISDELFDRALESSGRRALPISSAKDMRELGGIEVSEGKKICRNRLVRAGRLSELTPEDAGWLLEYGIGTIIDLRSEDEISEAPDINVSGFRRENCPLPAVKLTEYQKDIQEKYWITPPGEEKVYYLSEYISCIDMKEVYMGILTEESSQQSLRKVFDILCESESGILFHCTSGKDRTGIMAALILSALGASVEDVRIDYYTSALATFTETEIFAQSLRRQNYSASYIDEMRYYNGIGMSIAESVWEEIESRYGSIDRYLTEVLLSEKTVRRLKEKYIE